LSSSLKAILSRDKGRNSALQERPTANFTYGGYHIGMHKYRQVSALKFISGTTLP